jgi:hypothetical protein
MTAEIAGSALAAAAGGETVVGLKILAGGKIKLALLAAAFAAAVTTPFYTAHQTRLALREENEALRKQVQRLTALQSSNAALVTPIAQPAPSHGTPEEYHELLRLRGEVGVLRDQLTKANQARAANALAPGPGAETDPVDITLNFPNIPMGQLVNIYQNWSGKALTIAPEVSLNKTIWLEHFNKRCSRISR